MKYRKDKIVWECNNGGQVWSSDATTTATTTDSSSTFPAGFCAAGFSSINVAFIVSLLVDLVFQVGVIKQVCYDLRLNGTDYRCTCIF
jgi:hypothetical protein